jgi:hypothetical protein
VARISSEVMVLSPSDLPPEIEMLSRIVDGQPPDVRELFHYALTLLMVEDGKAEIVEQHTLDAREHLTLRTVAGDSFTIIKPFVSEELLAKMTEIARDILREEQGNAEENSE